MTDISIYKTEIPNVCMYQMYLLFLCENMSAVKTQLIYYLFFLNTKILKLYSIIRLKSSSFFTEHVQCSVNV